MKTPHKPFCVYEEFCPFRPFLEGRIFPESFPLQKISDPSTHQGRQRTLFVLLMIFCHSAAARRYARRRNY